MRRGLSVLVVLAVLAGVPAFGQTRPGMQRPERPLLDPLRGMEFPCKDGGSLFFSTIDRDAELIAIVQTGEGRHELPLKPWKVGDPPQITWSDGQHTLTWSPGVRLMWMDGPKHRDCGRNTGGHH